MVGAASSGRDRPISAMIIGDSMTQGSEGDFTWRYRLSQWLQDQDIKISFTGPYKGTQEPDEPGPPRPPTLYKHKEPVPRIRSHGGYAMAASDFDSHHFALWGRQMAQAKKLIEGAVREHKPDLLLVMLGFNDIGWFVSDAEGTINSLKQFVHSARQANSSLQFAIANIPQRTKMDGREDLPKSTAEYNHLLDDVVRVLSSEHSPVHIVDVCKQYTAEQASFDGLHPNALGDYQIARAFSIALNEAFKLGRKPLEIPQNIPERPLSTPTGFRLIPSPVGVTALWDQVYGALGYEVRHSVDSGEFTSEVRGANRWDSHWAEEGQLYQVSVRSLYGNRQSEWTNWQWATTAPELADAPSNIAVKATNNGVRISWVTPASPADRPIVQYSILWRDTDGSMFFPGLAAFKSSPAYIDELKPDHKYSICMLTWNTAGEGRPGDWKEYTLSGSLKED